MQIQSLDANVISVQPKNQPIVQETPVESVKLQNVEVDIEPVKEAEIDNTEIEQNLEEVNNNVKAAIEIIKSQVEDAGFNVRVRVDDRIKGFVATIVDKETGQVIKELPPKAIIELRASINEKVKGLLLDEKG